MCTYAYVADGVCTPAPAAAGVGTHVMLLPVGAHMLMQLMGCIHMLLMSIVCACALLLPRCAHMLLLLPGCAHMLMLLQGDARMLLPLLRMHICSCCCQGCIYILLLPGCMPPTPPVARTYPSLHHQATCPSPPPLPRCMLHILTSASRRYGHTTTNVHATYSHCIV